MLSYGNDVSRFRPYGFLCLSLHFACTNLEVGIHVGASGHSSKTHQFNHGMLVKPGSQLVGIDRKVIGAPYYWRDHMKQMQVRNIALCQLDAVVERPQRYRREIDRAE